jgi:hypothetical protein
MAAEDQRVDLLQVFHRRCVRRWRYHAGHPAFDEQVALGWLPDGRWWVEHTRTRLGWIFAADTSAEARAAAQQLADALMAQPREHPGGAWEPTTAEYAPVWPPRAADVPEWPLGYEPDAVPSPE